MSGQTIVASPDSFGQFRVKEMSESEFWLGSATPTSIKSNKCHIILFYEPTSTSADLINIWSLLAQTIGGPVIAAVNTSARGEIMDAFANVEADLDNPLNAFSGFGIPTIMVYRNRWPQAFYNGELSYDAIKKWILVLACKPGYKEPQSYFHGVRAVNPDDWVEEPRIENFPYPTSSRDFTAQLGEGSRGERASSASSDVGGEEEGLASDEEGADGSQGQYTQETSDVGFISE
jgi:hypothetical protein